MSNQFNLRRFNLLFKKHTVENYRYYLTLLFILLALFVLIVLLTTRMGTKAMPMSVQEIVFTYLLITLGTYFTSNIFANMGEKRQAIAALMLPTSAFENFLVGWVYSYLIFQVTFITAFYVIVRIFLFFHPSASVLNVFSIDQHVYIAYLLYALLNAIALYGAIYFKSNHFAKIARTIALLAVVITFINKVLLGLLLPYSVSIPAPFTNAQFKIDNIYYHLDAPVEGKKWAWGMVILLSFIIWTATYFRLKEKQV